MNEIAGLEVSQDPQKSGAQQDANKTEDTATPPPLENKDELEFYEPSDDEDKKKKSKKNKNKKVETPSGLCIHCRLVTKLD